MISPINAGINSSRKGAIVKAKCSSSERVYSVCFTYNMSTFNDSNTTLLEKIAINQPKVDAVVEKFKSDFEGSFLFFGHEVTSNNIHHLQGYMKFPNARYISSIRKAFPGMNIRKALGTAEQNIMYCSKGSQPKEEYEEHRKLFSIPFLTFSYITLLDDEGPNYGIDAITFEWGPPPSTDGHIKGILNMIESFASTLKEVGAPDNLIDDLQHIFYTIDNLFISEIPIIATPSLLSYDTQLEYARLNQIKRKRSVDETIFEKNMNDLNHLANIAADITPIDDLNESFLAPPTPRPKKRLNIQKKSSFIDMTVSPYKETRQFSWGIDPPPVLAELDREMEEGDWVHKTATTEESKTESIDFPNDSLDVWKNNWK